MSKLGQELEFLIKWWNSSISRQQSSVWSVLLSGFNSVNDYIYYLSRPNPVLRKNMWKIFCHQCQKHKENWWQNLPPVSLIPVANMSLLINLSICTWKRLLRMILAYSKIISAGSISLDGTFNILITYCKGTKGFIWRVKTPKYWGRYLIRIPLDLIARQINVLLFISHPAFLPAIFILSFFGVDFEANV